MSSARITADSPPSLASLRNCLASRSGRIVIRERLIAEETAVAFTYNGHSHAVMMATPTDLQDFAIGLSITEGVVASKHDITDMDIVVNDLGVELRMWITGSSMGPYAARRRALVGPTGCGLCGIETLIEASRPAPPVAGHLQITPETIADAISDFASKQVLNNDLHSLHAAAFWRPHEGIVALREDVGRHNALDKLVGALSSGTIDGASGIVLMTSRISVELVQKAAILGASILIAISAPTALAVRAAEACGMTLIGIARNRDFEAFTHTERIIEA